MNNKELEDLVQKSKEAVAKMTPQERADMLEKQKASFVRGMTTTCEHGVLDFEQCPKCRGWDEE